MASENQVKQFFAYWFLLGKKAMIHNGKESLLPNTIYHDGRYSQEFEECWQKIMAEDSGDCYLDGTDETVAQLLTPAWDIIMCARCPMPIALRTQGQPPSACPCSDLPSWPNTEMPLPKVGANSQDHLRSIRNRLQLSVTQKSAQPQPKPEALPALVCELPLDLPACECSIHSQAS